MKASLQPTTDRQRYVILDALRGFALMGICLANLPEFSLWTFLAPPQQQALSGAEADEVVRFLQYLLVDAKFYTIFSLLFGIGFSIILSHAIDRGSSGLRLFYRRMLVLALMALAHLLCLWSGDILQLYALVGMLLPVVHGLSDRTLLRLALLLWLLPVGLDLFQQMSGMSFAAPIEAAWWRVAAAYGITEANFATFLRDASSYADVHAFLMQGAVERLWELVDGHRAFKVFALFLLGYWAGRRRLYARLDSLPLRRLLLWCGGCGLPLSALYAWSAVAHHPWGIAVHALLYSVSALPMALCYVSLLSLLFLHHPCSVLLRHLAYPGRMALTCYIGQSVLGIYIYYGVGLGLGASMSLWQVELMALALFLVQVCLCRLWLSVFRFGPLEWVWRMLTYGRWLPLRRS